MTKHRGTTWSPRLVIAVALTYLIVVAVFLAVGYLIGRLLL